MLRYHVTLWITHVQRSRLTRGEHLEHEDGAIVFEHACAMGLEGIVSKRKGSRIAQGDGRWLKAKTPMHPQ